MKILNRFNFSVIFEYKCKTIKECVEKAIKSGANLSDANLYGANLYGADLRGANLYGADLRGANFRCANLYGADLRGANFRCADLSGADLSDADLSDADLRGANLYGAYLSCANLYGATILDEKLTKNLIYINAGFDYQIWISDTKIKIGCKLHTTSEWERFNDREILEMDGKKALEFWHKNKEIILSLAKHHQGEENE